MSLFYYFYLVFSPRLILERLFVCIYFFHALVFLLPNTAEFIKGYSLISNIEQTNDIARVEFVAIIFNVST